MTSPQGSAASSAASCSSSSAGGSHFSSASRHPQHQQHPIGGGDDDTDADSPINWQLEAQAIIQDLRPYVNDIGVSTQLPVDDRAAFLNITTLEGTNFCVRVDRDGYHVVSQHAHDTIDEEAVRGANGDDDDPDGEEPTVYETPYALLNRVSPRYVDAFGNALCKQLYMLQQMRTEFNEEDEDALDEEAEEAEEEEEEVERQDAANKGTQPEAKQSEDEAPQANGRH